MKKILLLMVSFASVALLACSQGKSKEDNSTQPGSAEERSEAPSANEDAPEKQVPSAASQSTPDSSMNR